MTVVAALVQDGIVHMAADTGSQMNGSITYTRTKVFKLPVPNLRRGAVLGFCGQAAVGALVQAKLVLPEWPTDGDPAEQRAWGVGVAEAICELATDAKPPATDSDGWVDACGLIGVAGRLWMTSQQEAAVLEQPFAAIGSGGDLALGALSVLPGVLIPAREQLVEAVEVACRFDGGCHIDHHGPVYAFA